MNDETENQCTCASYGWDPRRGLAKGASHDTRCPLSPDQRLGEPRWDAARGLWSKDPRVAALVAELQRTETSVAYCRLDVDDGRGSRLDVVGHARLDASGPRIVLSTTAGFTRLSIGQALDLASKLTHIAAALRLHEEGRDERG